MVKCRRLVRIFSVPFYGILDFFGESEGPDTGMFIAYLRSALATTTATDFQANLWLNNATNCSSVTASETLGDEQYYRSCITSGGGTSLLDVAKSSSHLSRQSKPISIQD